MQAYDAALPKRDETGRNLVVQAQHLRHLALPASPYLCTCLAQPARRQANPTRNAHSYEVGFGFRPARPNGAVEGSKGLREAPLVPDVSHATVEFVQLHAVGCRGCALPSATAKDRPAAGAMSFS